MEQEEMHILGTQQLIYGNYIELSIVKKMVLVK
jgi:FAD synthase